MKPQIPKKALIIRFRRVGDAVLAVSLCSSLKKTFPGICIDYVLNENIAPLFEGHPHIDKVITFDDEENHNVRKYLSKVRRIMRETHYDIIIDMRATIKTLFFSLFSLSTPFRIGTKKKYNALLLNHRVAGDTGKSDVVQYDLTYLSPLEKIAPVCYDSIFRLYASNEEQIACRTYMEEQGIDFSRKIVLVTPATRIQGKNWDIGRMREVIHRMIEKYHPQIIFNYSGEAEQQICNDLYDQLGRNPDIFININAKTLKELKTLISLCDFFFGNEGGPRHIAQALNIPAFAIYPPGASKHSWLPGNDNRFQGISYEDIQPSVNLEHTTREELFDLITADRVWAALDNMLNTHLK